MSFGLAFGLQAHNENSERELYATGQDLSLGKVP
ncbi:MAG: hypothetical protein ACI835_001215 [Planctomycetota bacterium]|jgi:hypothetical protein